MYNFCKKKKGKKVDPLLNRIFLYANQNIIIGKNTSLELTEQIWFQEKFTS